MRVEPPASLVDWGLLAALAVLLGTGLGSLVAATPGAAWVYLVHGAAGFALVVLLAWKLRRVWPRLRVHTWGVAGSVVLLALTLGALLTGVAWAATGPFALGSSTGLVVHAVLGVLVAGALLGHLVSRLRAPRTDPDAARRAAIGYGAATAAGVLGLGLRREVSRALGTVSRFTGSYHVAGAGNAYPETAWAADDPAPVDRGTWTLTVTGAVDTPRQYGHDAVLERDARPVAATTTTDPAAGDGAGVDRETRAVLLDCTSGWYAERDWTGVRVGSLLDASRVDPAARWVSFVSVTGYRWTLPLEEARDALLATHVDGELLSHGHGAPARLVAPGRRGYQWVKWVERVEVRRRPDPARWWAIFTSGLD